MKTKTILPDCYLIFKTVSGEGEGKSGRKRRRGHDTFNILKERLQIIKSGETLKTGTGVRKNKYKQPKRNAYKIQNSTIWNTTLHRC